MLTAETPDPAAGVGAAWWLFTLVVLLLVVVVVTGLLMVVSRHRRRGAWSPDEGKTAELPADAWAASAERLRAPPTGRSDEE